MKGIFRTIGVVFFALIVTTAFGQQRGQGQGRRNLDPETTATNSIKQMKEIIKITDKEEKAVKAVFLKYAKERQKLMEGMQAGGDREGMREKMTEMTKKQNTELEKLLDKERIEKYTKKLEELRGQRRRQG